MALVGCPADIYRSWLHLSVVKKVEYPTSTMADKKGKFLWYL